MSAKREGIVSNVGVKSWHEQTSPATAAWSDTIVEILADLAPRMMEAGLTDQATVAQLIAAWQAWGKHPDAFLGRSWCEAIGWTA